MHVVSEDTSVGTTQIHCPDCGARDVEGQVIQMCETMMEALVIPVSRHVTWWVVCSKCQARLFSKVDGDELARSGPDELAGLVYHRVDLVTQFFAVASILLALFPFLGLIVALLAWVGNRKAPGWSRTASRIGLWVAVLIHMGVLVLALLDSLKAR